MSNAIIRAQDIDETLEENYMPYAMAVNMARSFAEIDGLKPSHRKLLYTMYELGLLKGRKVKSSHVVGKTMLYNPHGDGAIYETMVRLTEGNEALIHPYIDSKGNFGKCYSKDMGYAAHRYTEAKLSDISEEFFRDIKKETVDFIPNFDSTSEEPVLLPVTYPNILVAPNIGIGVGIASSICSFNLEEVCDTTINYIKDETIDILDYLKAPDFSTGGELILNKKKMKEIYETGRGTFYLRGKYYFDEKKNCIIITEIPYTTNIESITNKIKDLVKNGSIKDLKSIKNVKDQSDRKGLKIAIYVKRNTDIEKLMGILFDKTTLQDNFSCNFNILVGGRPRLLGIKGILKYWIEFRVDCIKRSLNFDIRKNQKQLHRLKGLEKILLNIDKAIKIIKDTKKDVDVIPNLMKGFGIDEEQAEYIANIKLRNLNQEYLLNRTKDINKLEKDVKSLENTLSSEKKIKKLIIKELEEIKKKYIKPRKTEIILEDEIITITQEDLIEDYECTIFITKHGYIKKITKRSLMGNDIHKIKEDDSIIVESETTNMSEILFFTDKFNVYKLKAYELEDVKASDLGQYIPNVFELDEGENVIYATITTDFSGYMLFVYENGKVAKVPLNSYETKTNRKKLVNAYNDESKLIRMLYINEDIDLLFFRDFDPAEIKLSLINSSLINDKSKRNTKGIQVVRIKKGSLLSDVKLLDELELNDIEIYRGEKIPLSGTNLDPKDSFLLSSVK